MSCKPRSPVGLVNPPAKRKCEERSRTRRLGEPSRRRRPGFARGSEAAPTNGLGAEGELLAPSATPKDRLARRVGGGTPAGGRMERPPYACRRSAGAAADGGSIPAASTFPANRRFSIGTVDRK